MSLQKSAQDQLRQYIERAERIEEDRKALGVDLKDVFSEAKANGFDPKIMKKVLALRKKPQAERTEEEALIDTYMHALTGNDTPMGRVWSGDGDEREARP